MTRVPTFSTQQLILSHTLETQARVSDLQVQLASNKKSQIYSGVSRDALQLVSLETRRMEIAQFTNNINTAENRLALMDTTIVSIEDMALELRDTLDRTLQQPNATGGNLKQMAVNLRDAIIGLLNTRSGETHLFGGTRTDRLPVDITAAGYSKVSLIESNGTTVDQTFYDAYYVQVLGNTLPYAQGSFYNQIYFDKNGVAPSGPFPSDPNNPTLSEFVAEDPGLWQYYVDRLDSTQMIATPKVDYYQGDSNATVVRADVQVNVTTSVRANDVAFQQMLSAADAIANLPKGDANNTNEKAIIQKALDMVGAALGTKTNTSYTTLAQIRMNVTSARDTLTNTLDSFERFDAYAEGVIADLENIDQTEVIVRLQNDQSALDASFAMLGRLQSLSLIEFI